MAALLSVAATIGGGVRALREVVKLVACIAMQPPTPARFRHFLPAEFAIDRILFQPAMMMLRNIGRHPFRRSAADTHATKFRENVSARASQIVSGWPSPYVRRLRRSDLLVDELL